jgi:diketogulonate reductase-like aldo/keto reductase
MPFGTIKLNDDNELPAIAFGSGSVLRGHDATAYVKQALDNGFRHIDTAQAYENESSVGRALRESGRTRPEVYVTTKYFRGNIQVAIRDSLNKLGLKYVDLYLIHSPKIVEGDIEFSWREFENIKESGLSRSIGVSNFNLDQLQQLVNTARIVPAVNQIDLHPYNYAENKTLLEYAARNGIIIEAYSSLTPITKAPGGPADAPIAAAAKRLGATPAQVIFLWARSKGVAIVTTSSKRERLKEYLAVGDLRMPSGPIE